MSGLDRVKTEISLFSGAGGGVLGSRLAGIQTLAYCEWDTFCQGSLKLRMADVMLDEGTVTGDVRELDASSFKGRIDAVTAGFPCFVSGTLITTRHGLVPIEKICVHDDVMTHLGRWRRVTAIMSKAKAQVRKVTIGGVVLGTTDEHPFFARLQDQDGLGDWVAAKDLTLEHLIWKPEFMFWSGVVSNVLTERFETVFNIAVDEDESYVVHGLAVHNCQPFSVAGKQAGIDDPRNMWPATRRVIHEAQPKYALLENVPGLLAGKHGYFGTIVADLFAEGYSVVWDCVPASAIGAAHKRDRLWIVAWRSEVTVTTEDDKVGLQFAKLDASGKWMQTGGLRAAIGDPAEADSRWPLSGFAHRGRASLLAPMSREPGNRLGKFPLGDLAGMTMDAKALRAAAFQAPGSDDEEYTDTSVMTEAQRLWPTPSAGKSTANGDLLNADGTPWDGRSKPHSATTGRQIQTVLMDAVKHAQTTESIDDAVNNHLWPTPTVQDSHPRMAGDLFETSTGSIRARNADGSCSNRGLATTVAAREMWPTPLSTDGAKGGPNQRFPSGGETLSSAVHTSLQDKTLWPTPQAHDAAKGDADRVGRHGTKHGGRDLNDWAAKWPEGEPGNPCDAPLETWPTPTAMDGARAGKADDPADWEKRAAEKAAQGINLHLPLNIAVKQRTVEGTDMWPTPMARDWKGSNWIDNKEAEDNPWSDDLPTAVAKREMWPTPTANDTGRTPENYLAMRSNMAGGPRESVSSLTIAAKLAETQANERLMWPTPLAHDAQGSDLGYSQARNSDNLPSAVERAALVAAGIVPPSLRQKKALVLDRQEESESEQAECDRGIMSGLGVTEADMLIGAPTSDGLWPTPTAETNRKSGRALTSSGAGQGGGRRNDGGQSSPPALEQMVELAEGILPDELKDIPLGDLPPATRNILTRTGMWPTPTASDGEKGSPNQRFGTGSMTLSSAAHAVSATEDPAIQWPTPTSAGGLSGGNGAPLQMRNLILAGEDPTEIEQMFQRDPLHESKPGCIIPPETVEAIKAATDKAPKPQSSGSLNADWVEWLMGWPIGWTRQEPLGEQALLDWQRGMSEGTWWLSEPIGIPRIVRGQPHRAKRLKAIGNGQVPLCAWAAFSALLDRAELIEQALEESAEPMDLFDFMNG